MRRRNSSSIALRILQRDPIQPFHNFRVERPVGAPSADFYGGLISAQHSILRFRSGIVNDGMMAFTAGNNYVTGNVINSPAPVAMPVGYGHHYCLRSGHESHL